MIEILWLNHISQHYKQFIQKFNWIAAPFTLRLKTLGNIKSVKHKKSRIDINDNGKDKFNNRNEVNNNKNSNNEVDNDKFLRGKNY